MQSVIILSHLGFWSGKFSLIAPFPDHCLFVPYQQFVLFIKHRSLLKWLHFKTHFACYDTLVEVIVHKIETVSLPKLLTGYKATNQTHKKHEVFNKLTRDVDKEKKKQLKSIRLR